ncbi:conserved protein of unknown function (plasmid) [Streptantibioticus cattleyicolor NRRL 8057 = DSM 46488]|nr:conserved protein of unknown function [Streptantibioticus cattleyicolor NRRL 8057 = DSM 46488]
MAAIVAPFGTGRFYATEFRRRGWSSIAVTPPYTTLPPKHRVHHDDFLHVVEDHGDVARTAEALRQRDVQAVVAGSELGVPLAAALAHHLGLPGNPVPTGDARRDRAAARDTLADAGVPVVPTLCTDDLEEAVAWAARNGRRPYTLGSASHSAARDSGERVCTDHDDLVRAWQAMRGSPFAPPEDTPEAPGHPALAGTPLLLRAEVTGARYLVNTVSYAGHHRVTEIWAEHRMGRAGVMLCGRADLLPPGSAVAGVLTDHVSRALTALGIAYGAAHSEIVLTDDGPLLLTTEPRPDSGIDPVALLWATGSYHARDAVAALLDPLSLMDRPTRAPKYTCRIVLATDRGGFLNTAVLQQILSLPTITGTVGHLVPGSRLHRTPGLLTSPGALILVADDQTEIERDVQAVRILERDGLYQWQR